MEVLRRACAEVAARASAVTIETAAIPDYARTLRGALASGPAGDGGDGEAPDETPGHDREVRAAFWLTLDAINFGSGWFPTLRKGDGRSGYHTIAAGVRERFRNARPWSAAELMAIDATEIATVTGQAPDHELMGLFATSLRDLGAHVATDHAGSFAAVTDAAEGSAVNLAVMLGGWDAFADCSRYDGIDVPFLKRAQITAADLQRAGVADWSDLACLTMFADNLVPHVLRLDGILRFDPALVARIDRHELIEHGSPEEVEIRACALHAVELIIAAAGRPGLTAAAVDQHLWLRGQQPFYKASPRHRSRCTAY